MKLKKPVTAHLKLQKVFQCKIYFLMSFFKPFISQSAFKPLTSTNQIRHFHIPLQYVENPKNHIENFNQKFANENHSHLHIKTLDSRELWAFESFFRFSSHNTFEHSLWVHFKRFLQSRLINFLPSNRKIHRFQFSQ